MKPPNDQGEATDVIVQEPIFEIIVKRLREEIIQGVHPPGAPLRLKEIAGKFGTSLMPVREALHRLSAEELIVMHPRRGAAVALLEQGRVNDVLELRRVLLGEAVRVGVQHLAEADVQHVRSRLDDMERISERTPQDLEGFFTAIIGFYIPIRRGYGDHLIARILDVNDNFMRLFGHQVRPGADELQRVAAEHRQILAAVEQRDAERLQSLVQEHVEGLRIRVLEAVA